MDESGFRRMLAERRIPEDQIAQHLALAESFESWLQSRGIDSPPTAGNARTFSDLLVAEGRNSYENYLALARYGRFLKNDPMYVAVVELLDGSEALERLYEKLGATVGEAKRDEVFRGIDLPPLGTPSAAKPPITQVVMDRLEGLVDAETCRAILSSGLRDLEDEWYVGDREKYAESGNVDAYLERKGREFIAQLTKIRDEGGLFFTQPITDEVIKFVDSHPEIRQGVRQGNVLYEVKIPYMACEYLAESDEQLKRYYYCHCPWVRESLREGNVAVSPTFCLCSAGFHKKSWDVIFGRPLKAEVVESVLKGDRWCKIAIHLPEEALSDLGCGDEQIE
jgi:hypothetical protein